MNWTCNCNWVCGIFSCTHTHVPQTEQHSIVRSLPLSLRSCYNNRCTLLMQYGWDHSGLCSKRGARNSLRVVEEFYTLKVWKFSGVIISARLRSDQNASECNLNRPTDWDQSEPPFSIPIGSSTCTIIRHVHSDPFTRQMCRFISYSYILIEREII